MGTTSLHLLHNLTGCDQLQPPRAGGEPVRPAGRGRIHLFRLLPTRRLGTAHSNVQHGPGGRLTGFSARFDSRYATSTGRPRAVLKHSCIRAPKGGLPHGACCSRATSPTWRIPTHSTAQEKNLRAFQPGSTAELIDPEPCITCMLSKHHSPPCGCRTDVLAVGCPSVPLPYETA